MQTIKRYNKQTFTKWIETLASKARNDSKKTRLKTERRDKQSKGNTPTQSLRA